MCKVEGSEVLVVQQAGAEETRALVIDETALHREGLQLAVVLHRVAQDARILARHAKQRPLEVHTAVLHLVGGGGGGVRGSPARGGHGKEHSPNTPQR